MRQYQPIGKQSKGNDNLLKMIHMLCGERKIAIYTNHNNKYSVHCLVELHYSNQNSIGPN
jgi:hypothetical protein